jgi:glucose/arabinose dehydrogenase
MFRVTVTLALVVGFLSLVAPGASAATLPPGFTQTTYATGLGPVTGMDFAPDGRLFVASQDGVVRVVKSDGTAPTQFIKIPVSFSGERGLTGLALDPDFGTNHYVYVYYATKEAPIHNRVSRFVAAGDVALTSGGVPVETPLLDLDPMVTNSHVSGAMNFGGDGKLYVATGDNAIPANAQAVDNTFGKILRINKDGSIPTDNPFYSSTTGANRAIWATGFRNPFTFAVQPGTGRTFVNDVGQDAWEEIDELGKGGNYGWPTNEGPTSDPQFSSPLYAYAHADAEVSGCAITGGAFYSPGMVAYPDDFVGNYLFADFCEGWIKRFDPGTNTVTGFAPASALQPIDLDVGPDGNVYYLSRAESSVTKISYAGDLAPHATITTPTVGSQYSAGQTISFAGTGTDADDGTLPASAYTWSIALRDTTQSYPAMPATSGITSGTFQIPQEGHTESTVFYRVTLTVTDSKGRTNSTYVDVNPRKVKLSLATNVSGPRLTLDGQSQTIPYTGDSVVGVKRSLGAVSPQTVNGRTYEFVSWSDGGSATHTVTTPAVNTTYTATFREIVRTPTTVKLTPTADSYANAGAKATNFGTSASLCARGATTAPAVSYLRFVLPAAPAGKTLTSATLRYRTTTLASAGSKVTQNIAFADNLWTETGLTWNNRPTVRQSLGTAAANTVPNAAYTTTLKASELAGKVGTTVTVAVAGNGDDNVWFWSRNHANASYRPELTLTFN